MIYHFDMERFMNISYDHYRVFYNVAKYKSFTRAAEAMLCNQPNLTRVVKNLEEQLGCTLFERTNKGVRLTDDGQELYEHISAAFDYIQAGEQAVSAKHNMEHGVVSIGATEIALRCYLLPILSRYHQLYPGVRIKILNVSTPQAIKMITNKLVDIAIVTTPMDKDAKLNITALSTLHEVPICAKDFDIKDDITFKELSGHPIISLGSKTSTFDFYSEIFSKQNCSYSPDIEAATADQIIPLVKHGLGVSFVPRQFTEDEPDIRIISLKEKLPAREIVMVRKKDHSLPLTAKKLVELIKAD